MTERHADRFARWYVAAFTSLLALGVAAVPLSMLTRAAVGVPAAVAVAAWFAWLGSQVAVEADERGITVRGVVRLWRIPWEDVADVTVRPARLWPLGAAPFGNFLEAVVVRRDGSVVALVAMPLWDDERGRRYRAAVERWQARARVRG